MSTTRSYVDSNPRLSKENLYMVLALWMENFPDDKQRVDPLNKKVGAVLVLPSDMSYAIDFSRNGVHAVARLIMAHPNISEDYKVFVSTEKAVHKAFGTSQSGESLLFTD